LIARQPQPEYAAGAYKNAAKSPRFIRATRRCQPKRGGKPSSERGSRRSLQHRLREARASHADEALAWIERAVEAAIVTLTRWSDPDFEIFAIPA